MAYKKTHDLCVKVRQYQDRNGINKNFYENIGSIMQGEDGRSFLLLKGISILLASHAKMSTLTV